MKRSSDGPIERPGRAAPSDAADTYAALSHLATGTPVIPPEILAELYGQLPPDALAKVCALGSSAAALCSKYRVWHHMFMRLYAGRADVLSPTIFLQALEMETLTTPLSATSYGVQYTNPLWLLRSYEVLAYMISVFSQGAVQVRSAVYLRKDNGGRPIVLSTSMILYWNECYMFTVAMFADRDHSSAIWTAQHGYPMSSIRDHLISPAPKDHEIDISYTSTQHISEKTFLYRLKTEADLKYMLGPIQSDIELPAQVVDVTTSTDSPILAYDPLTLAGADVRTLYRFIVEVVYFWLSQGYSLYLPDDDDVEDDEDGKILTYPTDRGQHIPFAAPICVNCHVKKAEWSCGACYTSPVCSNSCHSEFFENAHHQWCDSVASFRNSESDTLEDDMASLSLISGKRKDRSDQQDTNLSKRQKKNVAKPLDHITAEVIRAMISTLGVLVVVRDTLYMLGSQTLRKAFLAIASTSDRALLMEASPALIKTLPTNQVPPGSTCHDRYPMLDTRYKGLSVIEFHSSKAAPVYIFSNFHRAPILFTADMVPAAMQRKWPKLVSWLNKTPAHFPSSEHLWHALKALDYNTFRAFTSTGILARYPNPSLLDSALVRAGVKAGAFWQKKDMIGIVPKMVVNPKSGIAAILNLNLRFLETTPDLLLSPAIEKIVWLTILRQKYEQNPAFKRVLVCTGNTYLLEYAKGARRAYIQRKELDQWGGLITREPRLMPGSPERIVLYGENKMGRYLMALRTQFNQETSSEVEVIDVGAEMDA